MKSLNSELTAAVVDIVAEIFTTMIMMDIEEMPAEQSGSQRLDSNITSMIGLGGAIRGSLALHFPEASALAVTSGFLGLEVEEIDEDVQDAIGELANMMAGGVKSFLGARGIETELAIPNTIVGRGYRTHGLAGAEKVTVHFLTPSGPFVAEMKYLLNS